MKCWLELTRWVWYFSDIWGRSQNRPVFFFFFFTISPNSFCIAMYSVRLKCWNSVVKAFGKIFHVVKELMTACYGHKRGFAKRLESSWVDLRNHSIKSKDALTISVIAATESLDLKLTLGRLFVKTLLFRSITYLLLSGDNLQGWQKLLLGRTSKTSSPCCWDCLFGGMADRMMIFFNI